MSDLPPVDVLSPNEFFENKGTDKNGNKRPGSFLPAKLAKEITATLFTYDLVTPRTIGEHKSLWRYDKGSGIFKRDGKTHVEQWVKYFLEEKATPHRINQVVELIKIDTYIETEEFNSENPRKIVCANGVIDLETGELGPFDPELFAKSRIPVKYNPEAKCPAIEKFLDEVVGFHSVTIYEWGGYCLWKEMPLHRLLALLGGGRNGKGTLIDFLTAFVGKENVSGVPLQALDGNYFMSSQLFGKLGNFYTDLSAKALKNTGTLKALTSGDRINAQFKYRDPFDFRSHAKILVSCNELPTTMDQTDAFFRRYIGVPCENKFDDGVNADLDMLERLTTPEELSGFLNLALKALHDLLERGKFLLEKPIEDKRADYIERSNPIHHFALTQVVRNTDPENYITNSDFYTAYANYCRDREVIPKDSGVFSRKVRMFLPYADNRQRSISGKNTKVWLGIELRSMPSIPKDEAQSSLSDGACTSCGRVGLPLEALSRSKKLCPRCRGEWEAPQ